MVFLNKIFSIRHRWRHPLGYTDIGYFNLFKRTTILVCGHLRISRLNSKQIIN